MATFPGCAALFVADSQALDQAMQSLDSIVDAVKNSAEQKALEQGHEQVNVNVRPLDNRLTLPECEVPLQTFSPTASKVLGSVAVGVKCTGATPWSIFIRADVTVSKNVPVLLHGVPRNGLITASDIHLVSQDISGFIDTNVIYSQDQLLGMEAVRPLLAGKPIRFNEVRPPKVIRRGQLVTLITQADSLEVRAQGKAMKDAASGEALTVTNLNSGKSVQGIANQDGSVTVP